MAQPDRSKVETGLQVTLRDIARRLGISHTAVSLALRDRPEISVARRRQIQAAAEEMGYRPNSAASALSHFKRTSSVIPVQAAIAWVNCWPKPQQLRSYGEFDLYWQGASQAAEKFGYHLEEFILNDQMTAGRLEKILLARGIDGVLIPPQRNVIDWGALDWNRFSVVRFGRSVQTLRFHIVTADQLKNSMIAFNEARSLGYERIGFIGGYFEPYWHFDAGYLKAKMDTADLPHPPIFPLHDHKADLPALIRWLKKYKPDAILTDDAGLPELLKKAGYRVPEDIGAAAMSVLDGGFDAGIDQNSHEIGRVAVLVIISLINDNARGSPPVLRQVLVEGKWVDGSSLPRRAS